MLDDVKQTDSSLLVCNNQRLASPYRRSESAMDNNDDLITSQLSKYNQFNSIYSLSLSSSLSSSPG